MPTRAEIPQRPSLQELFDYVTSKLLKQGQRSVDNDSICKYRGKDCCCAAGFCIPDEDYSEDMENKPYPRAIVAKALGFDYDYDPLAEPAQLKLLDRLLTIHDHRCVLDWPDEFAELAMERGLTFAFEE